MADSYIMRRAAHVRQIRDKLGVGLREAADFHDQNPATVVDRLEKAIGEHAKGIYWESPIEKVRATILRYYATLDREGGGVSGPAMVKAFKEIEDQLGMGWVQGATLKKES